MKKISLLIIAILFLSLIGCTGSTSNQKNKVLFLGLDDKLINTIYVEDNENFEYPKAPSVEGYEFVEWDLKLFQVTKDTTIRAIYKKNIYRLIYKSCGITTKGKPDWRRPILWRSIGTVTEPVTKWQY